MAIEFKNIQKYCENCGNELILKNTRDIKRKRFCSRKCNASYLLKELWKNENYSEKIRYVSSLPNPKKASRVSKKPINVCSYCGNNIQKNIGKSGHVYCSKECYNLFRKLNLVKREDSRKRVILECEFCHKKYEKQPSVAKNSKYCSVRCHNISNYINMPKKETSIEILLRKELEKNNIIFENQHPILKRTISDFFIEPNLVIYADGNYWHNIPFVKKRDESINNLLCKNDFVVLRYTEDEIKNNMKDIIKDIKNNI